MKRTRNISENAIWWLKKGGGRMYLADGRVVKQGEKFQASEADVNGLEVWLEPLEEKPSIVKPVGVKAAFFLRQRSAAWWDVVDNQGKVVNENALRKGDAEELQAELEA